MQTENFTKAFVEGLICPSASTGNAHPRLEVADKKVRGLILRVTPSGTKTFGVYKWMKAADRPVRATIGTYPDVSIEEARKRAHEILSEIASGKSPSDLLREKRSEMSLAAFFIEYLDQHAKPFKKSWRADISMFERYVNRPSGGLTLGKTKLSAVAKSDVTALITRIGKKNPTTANRVLALISSVFGRAREWGYFEGQNPASGIKRFKETSRDRFLQEEEMARFLRGLARLPNVTQRDFFLTCLLTGARRSNALAMRWEHIDLTNHVWNVPASESKGGKAQQIHLCDPMVQLLTKKSQDRSSPFVFPGIGKTGHLQEPKSAWKVLLNLVELEFIEAALAGKGIEVEHVLGVTVASLLDNAKKLAGRHDIDISAARLPHLTIHDLRRTLGSWQAKTGASLLIIGKSLQHQSSKTTEVYARLDSAPVARSVNIATCAMLGTLGNPDRARNLVGIR
jgi:integrase